MKKASEIFDDLRGHAFMEIAPPDSLVGCIHYGDCPHNCECEEDEPWAKCKHREMQPNIKHEAFRD